MVIMPDNWPLGTRHVSFTGCLDGGRGERTDRQKKEGNGSTEGENEGGLNDGQKWM